MTAQMLVFCFLIYFALLYSISYIVGNSDSNASFFAADKKAPWYLVAFGMIGATLSGVTFISVPGWVTTTQLGYVQMVLGYALGYLCIGTLLLPLYYKWNVVSIYTYLQHRFGEKSYKTGAAFFILSRITGTSFRLFLLLKVLHWLVLDEHNIPFWLSAAVALLGIWLYTKKSGIKTIIYTDTAQTLCMLIALSITIYALFFELQLDTQSLWVWWQSQPNTQLFFWEDWSSGQHFIKQFFAGALIAFAMTGLDQDMMQKNLTCKSLKDAQKNMIYFSIVLVFVTFLFMLLGALLYIYSGHYNIEIPLMDGQPRTDLLFPEIALNGGLGLTLAIIFMLGLIAAAYSSADSALTSLTTSFCIDFLNIERKNKKVQKRLRKKVHIGMSILLVIVIIIFKHVLTTNVIDSLLTVAGYTYGPLLGLFAFGIFTKFKIKDNYVWIVGIIAVIITAIIGNIPSESIGGYVVGYELLPINGLLTFFGLILIRRK